MKNTGLVFGGVLVIAAAVLLLGGIGMMGFGGFGMMGPGIMRGYGGYGGMWGMMRGYGLQGFGISPIGAILSLVFWAFIIGGVLLLVVWLARNAARPPLTAPLGGAALEILRTRYARGEINKEQFDAIKRDLGT